MESLKRLEASLDRVERTLFIGFAAISSIWCTGCGVVITLILTRR